MGLDTTPRRPDENRRPLYGTPAGFKFLSEPRQSWRGCEYFPVSVGIYFI